MSIIKKLLDYCNISIRTMNKMLVRDFWLNISLNLVLNLLPHFVHSKQVATSGPFRASISDVAPCEKGSYPYVKDPPIFMTAAVYNDSNTIILNCNFTVTRQVKNTKFRMKSFIWVNDKWRPNYIMNDIGCNGVLLQYIVKAVGIKYDREKCWFIKGQYQMKNVNLNAIQHLWTAKMEYGKTLWKGEMFNPRLGTYYCIDFFTTTEPA